MQSAIILIASDSLEDAQIISAILGKGGYAVRCVNSSCGLMAIAKFSPPNLIFMDTTLLKVDNSYNTEQLRTNEFTRNIPVILFCGMNNACDIIEDTEIASFYCITKPFQADEVLVRVESQLTIQPYY
ncbi:MAG: response regulator [Calothrix sp. SM1_7_51]|nr:response regulator [Calothrix sp. SM1_7_51]